MKKLLEKQYIQCILVTLAVIAVYTLWSIFKEIINVDIIKIGMAALVVMTAAYIAVCGIKKELTVDNAIKAVIFAGFVMRIGYMLYTPCDVRSHDLWEISTESHGHAGYILGLIENNSLPQSNDIQFYQQPFFYIVSSVVSKLKNMIVSCDDVFYLVDAAKTVSCSASCMVLIVAGALCDTFRLKDTEKLAAMVITAFHPSFFLGIRITPDMLCTFFMVLALLFTFRWYDSPDWKNTLILSLVYGFGVMTKISVAVPALFTAVVFAVKLVRFFKEKKALPVIMRLAVFGIISLPLGLWYNVRNYKLFGQKLGYILEIGKESDLYVGDRSLFQRFVLPDFGNLLSSPYANVWEDHNLLVYSIKSSLFGEFTFKVPSVIPIILYISAIVLSVLAAIAVVSALKRCNEDKPTVALSAVCILFLVSVIIFNLRYPHGCSMDFRYSTFLIIPFAVLIAKRFMRYGSKIEKNMLYICIAAFSCSSCLMYIMV
ncbi:MAG: ArnT family glycosyltransferase [Oscillospiraceae bacterium]